MYSNEITPGTIMYVTKWSLSNGIRASRVLKVYSEGTLVSLEYWGDSNYFSVGSDCFLSETEAREQVEKMRAKEIRAAEKKLEKLKKLEVKITPA